MKDLPNPFWACILILMACAVAITALYSHSPNAASVITLGTSIVTGAFGFIVGKEVGRNSVQIPTDPPTQAQVTITPAVTDPKP